MAAKQTRKSDDQIRRRRELTRQSKRLEAPLVRYNTAETAFIVRYSADWRGESDGG